MTPEHPRWRTPVACAVLLLLTAGCSTSSTDRSSVPATPTASQSGPAAGGSAGAAGSSASPSASPVPAASSSASSVSSASSSGTASATPSASASAADRFQNAVSFVRDVENGDLGAAAKRTAPKSVAARYVSALRAVAAARKTNGENSGTGVVPTVSTQADDQSITIDDGTGTRATWSHFSYDGRERIVSWRSGSTRLSSLVATHSDSAKALGASVTLVAAYRAANGNLYVVAGFRATREVALNGAVGYRVGGRTRHSTDSSTLPNLKKGKTTTAYYVFADTSIGGRITIPVDNPGYTAQASVTLAVA